MNALDKPSSLMSEELLAGSQTPDTGAYPDGPPISFLVSQMATSCFSSLGDDLQIRSLQRLTLLSDCFELPSIIG